MSGAFATVRTVGGVLPPDVLARVVAGDPALGGLRPADYHLAAGETPREAANRAWSYLVGTWAAFRHALDRLPAGDPAVGLTREKWLSLLFRELGYGRLPHAPTGGLVVGDPVDGRAFAVSHVWEHLPVHLLGWGVDLDRRTPGVAGAAGRAPQAMLQELLNRSDDHLWGVVSNGRLLRLLRDSTALSGQSSVEFDLEAMFDGEVFSDFALLFLLLHQSRVEVLDPADGGGSPADCWLERWRTAAAETGTRALGLLRDGVRQAIEALGTGVVRHPDNADLTRRLALPATDPDAATVPDLHRALLRLVYRLLFLFVAEDRDALLAPDADPLARDRYDRYFSTARLRRLATVRRGSRHPDLWQALALVLDGLGRDGGRPELGLPGLGGLFEAGPADLVTGLSLANEPLLTALRHLSVVQPRGQPRRTVDYRNLGAEELGGIYESLLELVPRYDPLERAFTLEALAGNERKTSGSYYTPSGLIDLVLDTALDPLLDDAEKSADPAAALLALTVCDPACGSGHFLVAAARRIATRLAMVRTGEVDPTPADLQEALHEVVARCLYGVDVNPLAAELAKLSLWLEALQPGRPLSFLDAQVKVGNSLLGTTPSLLAAGIPVAAYAPLEGDDRKHAAALRKRNTAERDRAGQGELFADEAIVDPGNRDLRDAVAALRVGDALSLADVHLQARRFRDLQQSPELREARFEADAWCAAFLQHKTPGTSAVTTKVLTTPVENLDPALVAEVRRVAARHRLFHWHLEFPGIFDVPTGGAGDTATGWRGGFSCVIGNPPWETLQMTEKEYFAAAAPEIAAAPNAAGRKRMIAELADTDPTLHAEFMAESRRGAAENHVIRDSGRYPLTARGKINTYSVFAETMRTVIRPDGRMGVITPTGLATDATTAAFFADTLADARLGAFYDFENEAKIFAGVHHAFRFAVTSMTGGERVDRVRFAFLARHLADVPQRRFELSPDEILLLNPNTGTLPLFRSRIDAEITLAIYRRHPVLIREGDVARNPWSLSFRQGLFNMASDSGLFRTAADLSRQGAQFDGWGWSKGDDRWLPLYEAKLLNHYDHRFSTYEGATQAQLNVQTLPRLSDSQHDNPATEPLARYWVAEGDVEAAIGERWARDWFLGWRDITGQEKWRTFVPSVLPCTAVADAFLLVFTTRPEGVPLLQAAWSSTVGDYVARQKLSGTHMKFFVTRQLACPAPDTFAAPAPWHAARTLADFVTPRVLELSYTSYRIAPYARDLGDDGPPFRWLPDRREMLRAELDAAMFHVYGLTRPEVEHVLDSFFVVRKYEERPADKGGHGEFRTKRLVLDRYDAMQAAVDTGVPYQTALDPPPGHGARHPERLTP